MKMYNTDSEQAVIGAIYMVGNCLHDVINLITPESFYHEEYQAIYASILELDKSGSEVEIIAIADELERQQPTDEWLISAPFATTLRRALRGRSAPRRD